MEDTDSCSFITLNPHVAGMLRYLDKGLSLLYSKDRLDRAIFFELKSWIKAKWSRLKYAEIKWNNPISNYFTESFEYVQWWEKCSTRKKEFSHLKAPIFK